jgi:hypothetical protein
MRIHRLSVLAAASLLLLPAIGASAIEPSFAPTQAITPESLDVPYVPTPQSVVDKMLDIAKVTGEDYLIDLGSGDGRIPIAAAKRFGTKGMGVEIDPVRVQEAKTNAVNARVADKVEFKKQDLFETDLSQATVLTMYLLPRVNLQQIETWHPGRLPQLRHGRLEAGSEDYRRRPANLSMDRT